MCRKADILSERLIESSIGCWDFIGSTTHGHGQLTIDGVHYMAHRLSWEIEYGPIPDQLWVLHKCDNRRCCNPMHLFLGTPKDNAEDMRVKGRDTYGNNFGENNGQAKLTEDDVLQIRQLLVQGQFNLTRIGELFDVSRKTIEYIRDNKTWSYLNG